MKYNIQPNYQETKPLPVSYTIQKSFLFFWWRDIVTVKTIQDAWDFSDNLYKKSLPNKIKSLFQKYLKK